MLAAFNGHVNVVKTLFERKADVNMLTEVTMYVLLKFKTLLCFTYIHMYISYTALCVCVCVCACACCELLLLSYLLAGWSVSS